MNHQPILLAEDSAEDAYFIRRAFEKAQVTNRIEVVPDGQQALAYLRGLGQYADRDRFPFPVLVLLDMKMPGMDGMQTLAEIRKDPELKRLVVIFLTSANQESEINLAFDQRVNAYLVKSSNLERMAEACERLKNYWLLQNHFPRPPGDENRNRTVTCL
ncbi:MAG TPA: response regulator [Verrucomicrobiae bacterium]|nr:response regulator [Verrucomicrobiae bacterium]